MALCGCLEPLGGIEIRLDIQRGAQVLVGGKAKRRDKACRKSEYIYHMETSQVSSDGVWIRITSVLTKLSAFKIKLEKVRPIRCVRCYMY